jgi:ferritin-like protein
VTTRRQFLRTTGFTAAALTIGSAVLPIDDLLAPASAQQVKLDDGDYAAFAETVELAAAGAYGPLRARLTNAAALAATAAAAQHHQAHANAIGPLAGKKRVGKPNPGLLRALTDQIGYAANETAVIQVAYDLENALAATHLFLLDSYEGKDPLTSSGSILPVEAGHAVLLGLALGKAAKDITAPDTAGTGFETQDKHVDPATFPAVPVAAKK